MCGIGGGVFRVSCLPSSTSVEAIARSIQTALRHRGPDDRGMYRDEKTGVVLVHTRLSILDLSPAGHQPMETVDGRYAIVFNGEIYNFRQLRAELEQSGVAFRSHSDTEVLLHLFVRDGEAMVAKLEGMFAFAIWDTREQSLFMARDPLGIKPLYIWEHEGNIAFASELHAVLEANIGPKRINPSAVCKYLLFGSVPEPDTLISDIKILPAGHSMYWRDGRSSIRLYWSPSYTANSLSVRENIQLTRNALAESLDRHFVSDVPVGVFLSGGIDSTVLVALAHDRGIRNLQTFCISFNESEFNEGNDAARTASHFGTKHHDWRLDSRTGIGLFEEFIASMDQPSNDGFNTFCVSRHAQMHGMKVVLSGLGGDELFGSYPSFRKVPKLMQLHGYAKTVPGGRAILGRLLCRLRPGFASDRIHTFLRSNGSPLAAFWAVRSFFLPSEAEELTRMLTGECVKGSAMDYLNEQIPDQPTNGDTVGYLETTRYMRNQLLRDSDVYSMASGLELRVPLADKRLLDTVNCVPANQRLSTGKQLLLDAVPEVPHWIANAPKRGFRFPFEDWIRECWNDEFVELERETHFSLGSWYRKWTLFSLKQFLKRHGL